MKKVLSTLILASAFALLVPDNRAIGAADLLPMPAAVSGQGLMSAPAVSDRFSSEKQVPEGPELSWLLALGFLGAVVARRLRAD